MFFTKKQIYPKNLCGKYFFDNRIGFYAKILHKNNEKSQGPRFFDQYDFLRDP